jgi:hypothetical protein
MRSMARKKSYQPAGENGGNGSAEIIGEMAEEMTSWRKRSGGISIGYESNQS